MYILVFHYFNRFFNNYRIPLRDNRDNSYKQALAQNINARTQMVLAVVGGAKSQYDVIKKYCCRESPGTLSKF